MRRSFDTEFGSTVSGATSPVVNLAGHGVVGRLYTRSIEFNFGARADNAAAARLPSKCERIVAGVASRCRDMHPVTRMNRTWTGRAAQRRLAGSHEDLRNATHRAPATIIHTYRDRVSAHCRACGVPVDLGPIAFDGAGR